MQDALRELDGELGRDADVLGDAAVGIVDFVGQQAELVLPAGMQPAPDVTWDSQPRQLICRRRLMCSWMATATPADTTIAARIQSCSTSIVVSRFSRALKKSRFQMLSQSAMPTLMTPNTTMPAVNIQATNL